jgi:ribosomal protein L31
VKHEKNTYFLQHDHDTHVTWTGKHVAAAATGQVAKFKRRFDFLSAANAVLGSKKK